MPGAGRGWLVLFQFAFRRNGRGVGIIGHGTGDALIGHGPEALPIGLGRGKCGFLCGCRYRVLSCELQLGLNRVSQCISMCSALAAGVICCLLSAAQLRVGRGRNGSNVLIRAVLSNRVHGGQAYIVVSAPLVRLDDERYDALDLGNPSLELHRSAPVIECRRYRAVGCASRLSFQPDGSPCGAADTFSAGGCISAASWFNDVESLFGETVRWLGQTF